jgi:hypothetical protein
MEKKDFKEHTRCTLTANINGKLRPANVYILKLHSDGMVVRLTDKEGILRKIAYEDVAKIVDCKDVPKQNHYATPDIMLTEQNWKGRSEIQHYASSPHMGK